MSNRIAPRTRRALTASLFAATCCFASATAFGAVVCGPANNTPIPATLDGVYINLVTGQTGIAGGDVPGWDWNPYGVGPGNSAIIFWWPAPAGDHGAVVSGGAFSVLPPGVMVDATSTFATTNDTVSTANWAAGSSGQFLGIRFFNEAEGIVNYGWVQMDTTGPGGLPGTIVSYCYQTNGSGLETGNTVPVELQSFEID